MFSGLINCIFTDMLASRLQTCFAAYAWQECAHKDCAASASPAVALRLLLACSSALQQVIGAPALAHDTSLFKQQDLVPAGLQACTHSAAALHVSACNWQLDLQSCVSKHCSFTRLCCLQIDKEGANPERVKQEMREAGLLPEEWGGKTPYIEVSALYCLPQSACPQGVHPILGTTTLSTCALYSTARLFACI